MTLDILGEFEAVVVALEGAGVPWAVCGGLAVNIHGHVRSTLDIDVLVPAESLEPLMAAVGGLGFTLRAGPIPFGSGTSARRELHRASKVVGDEVLTVDALIVTPVLEEAWAGREILEWRGHPLPTVSRSGLIAMKRLAGRHQDLADIEKLEGDVDG